LRLLFDLVMAVITDEFNMAPLLLTHSLTHSRHF
jgi:hypothetical protein